ncbi:hypothetical protein Glove_188g85 [Diversispora epigaea]|uniref:TLC domain-containing protein n=1 Tax=Diversispora epigaea TaxID=1348612 RepID=A0A397ILI0_9GLOM|nr:hypothetical protein Glove_188g85 [Diversispora epigaea]
MESCTAESVRIIGCSFIGFTVLNYVVCRSTSAITHFYKNLDERRRAIWNNTFVSYIHSWICSIITPLCFYYFQNAWSDMINTDVFLVKAQIALSIGFFFADMFDFYRKNIFMDSSGIWFHHVVVCSTFVGSVISCKYSPYLAANLLAEISNVFLHQRKLYLTAYRTKSTPFYYYNSILLFITFIFTRIFTHGYILVRVWNEYLIFGHISYWRTAFIGMITTNILNLKLFSQLWDADWSKLNKMRNDWKINENNENNVNNVNYNKKVKKRIR